MDIDICYSIKGIMTFAPTYVKISAETEEALDKITNDEIIEKIMEQDNFPVGKQKEAITIYRKKK